jgi:hypothetical protein
MAPNSPEVDAGTAKRLGYALSEFQPEGESTTGEHAFSGTRKVSYEMLPEPRLVQWVLEFLGSEDGGRWEKTAWRFWFRFRSRPFSLAFEKFGLRLYGAAGTEDEFALLADDLVRQLDKAVRIAETEVFQGFADQQVRAGRVTIHNDHHLFRNMYEAFRLKAEEGAPIEDPNETRSLFLGEITRVFVDDEHRFHYTIALLNAYFAWLEHVLVLFWPFCGYQPGIDDPERLIGDRWYEKFRTIFDVTTDTTAKHHYDHLRDVADEYRNTFDHGGFGRKRRGMLVHVPGGAPIQAGLSSVRGSPHFEFYPVQETSLQEILTVLDAVDDWLNIGPAEFGMRWVEAGLDVAFDSDSVRDYNDAMDSGTFEELIERWAYFSDQAANMDW